MNWYSLYKIAQIWQHKGSGSFEDNLISLYEFEYKYATVNAKLNATTQRKENILNNLKVAFTESAQEVVEVLLKTFNNWLEGHALLDPDLWAKQRASTLDPAIEEGSWEHKFDLVLSEYARYAYSNLPGGYYKMPMSTQFSNFIKAAFKNIDNLPVLKSFMENTLLPEHRNYLLETLESEGLKEFNASQWKKFRSKQQAENYIEKITMDAVDIDDLFYTFMPDKESFDNVLANSGMENEVLQELFKVLVFPLWKAHWIALGIDETRNNVQEIYDSLNSINYSNLGNTSAIINIALNAAHQNGSMIEYIEEITGEDGLKSVLDGLTRGDYAHDWNEELKKELNIKMPKVVPEKIVTPIVSTDT